MSINSYFLRQPDAMPRKKNQISDASEEHNQPASTGSIDPSAKAPHASTDANLTALREAVGEITANISKVIDEKLGPISELLKKHGDILDDHGKRLTEAEQRISALEDAADPAETKVKALESMVDYLSGRVDDLENRGRRKNIRILGLPEGIEGNDPTRFFESWLAEALHIETKAGRIKLERAHRTLAPKPSSTQRPRPVLVRFHNFQDKQRVMNKSWELGKKNQPVKYGDSTVMFFQDLSAAVLRKRKEYDAVKRQLKSLGAEYRLIYPALLKITLCGSSKVFKNPQEAEQYANSLMKTHSVNE